MRNTKLGCTIFHNVENEKKIRKEKVIKQQQQKDDQKMGKNDGRSRSKYISKHSNK